MSKELKKDVNPISLTKIDFVILQNMSNIGTGGVLFKPGQEQDILSPNRTILMRATLSFPFDKEIAVYNIGQFYKILEAFENPDIHFKSDYMDIVSGRESYKFYYSDKDTVTPPPKGLPKNENPIIFEFDGNIFGKLLYFSKIYSTSTDPFIRIFTQNGKLYIGTCVANSRSTYETEICDTTENIDVKILSSYFSKLLKGDYDVSVSRAGNVHFKHKTLPVEYYLPVEMAESQL